MDRPDFVWRGRPMNILSLTEEQKINIARATNLADNWYESYAICRLEDDRFMTVDILVDGECYYLVPVAKEEVEE